MPERPMLNKKLNSKAFREWYHLKEELIECWKYKKGHNQYEKVIWIAY